jgi:hypothetical protein
VTLTTKKRKCQSRVLCWVIYAQWSNSLVLWSNICSGTPLRNCTPLPCSIVLVRLALPHSAQGIKRCAWIWESPTTRTFVRTATPPPSGSPPRFRYPPGRSTSCRKKALDEESRKGGRSCVSGQGPGCRATIRRARTAWCRRLKRFRVLRTKSVRAVYRDVWTTVTSVRGVTGSL